MRHVRVFGLMLTVLALGGCDTADTESMDQTPQPAAMAEAPPPEAPSPETTPQAPRPSEPMAASEPVAAPEPPPAQPAAPAPVAETPRPATETVVQPMPMETRTIYLASYRSQKRALKGFHQLQAMTPALKDAKPTFKEVDIPHKGHFIRLYAEAGSPETADQACNDLIKLLPDCGAASR